MQEAVLTQRTRAKEERDRSRRFVEMLFFSAASVSLRFTGRGRASGQWRWSEVSTLCLLLMGERGFWMLGALREKGTPPRGAT